MEGNQSHAFRLRLAQSLLATAFSCRVFTARLPLATARFMTAGVVPKDYDLHRSREVGVLVVGLMLAALSAFSAWMGVLSEPCYPVMVLALALIVCLERRRAMIASKSAGPSFWSGVCQLAAYWVLADRIFCLAAAALDVQAVDSFSGFARIWWFIGQGWLLLMALLATTTLSQAWSAGLQAAVVEMRHAARRR